MSSGTIPVLVAVPPDGEGGSERAYELLRGVVTTNNLGECARFRVPELKIGTLDTLITNAEELEKLDSQCEGYVYKIHDVLKSVLQNDAAKLQEQSLVADAPADEYLTHFAWSNVKYRADKPISALMETMSREGQALESDVRGRYSQYNGTRSQLQQFQRRAQGNLATRHLGEVVRREHVVQNSDFLETRFFAVPVQRCREWEASYESLSQMVVPRSSVKISQDPEYALYGCVVFRKFSQELSDKARAAKFVPREFTYDVEESARARKEFEEAQVAEKRQWGEVLRLCGTSFSDAFQLWIHVKALRAFVEAVLRYGLPPKFACAVITPHAGKDKQLAKELGKRYAYLANRDFEAAGLDDGSGGKKGKGKKQQARGGQEGLEENVHAVESGLGVDGDFVPYVVFPINW